ncbi:MAG: VPDSG-CTERM sorting domain-containing protein [Candidatus Udaeobacter sp.]
MKISTFPRSKLLLCIAICAAALAASQNANALSIGDSHELGFLLPSGSSGNQSTYVNHLMGMALGSIDIANGQIYFRSNNAFGPLPTAVQALSGSGTTINLGSGGLYTYLLANYAGFGSEVWYVGDLHGIITIPGFGNGCLLTKWSLFRAGVGVPDGGTTVMLLGVALGALGVARRYIMS